MPSETESAETHRPDLQQPFEAGIPLILQHLQKVAASFGLPFDAGDYTYFPMTARQKVLLDYLSSCPGLPHSNWGNDDAVRRQRIAEFLASADYNDYCAGLTSCGSVLGSEVAQHLSACCRDQPLPKWVQELAELVERHTASQQAFFVVICLQQPTEAMLRRLLSLLAHEWSHLLFFSNGINFQTTAPTHPDAWLFDEGLASWSEYAYLAGEWDCRPGLEKSLKTLQDRGKPRSVTGYFEKGLWFNQHFNALPIADWPAELRSLPERLPIDS
ncbi:MAG: hypothetical protein ACAI44_22930 [Candidatus Sericytochromatia bacterium]